MRGRYLAANQRFSSYTGTRRRAMMARRFREHPREQADDVGQAGMDDPFPQQDVADDLRVADSAGARTGARARRSGS